MVTQPSQGAIDRPAFGQHKEGVLPSRPAYYLNYTAGIKPYATSTLGTSAGGTSTTSRSPTCRLAHDACAC
jgi:hypothetical protein